MRVLLWSQYFWPENFRINELAAALQAGGMQVTVLTGKPNYPQGDVFPGYRSVGIRRERYAGAQVVRVPLVPRGAGSPLRLAINYLSFIISGYALAPLALRRHECDVVFVYAPSPVLQALPAIFLARLKRAPLVLWVQDLWPESLLATGFIRNRWALGMVEAVVRHIYRHADSILIQSEAFREPVTRLAGDPGKVRYFPNTAEAVLDPSAGVGDSGLVSELKAGFSVVFAGNIGAAQAVETILAAAERLAPHPDIRFFILGSGSREAWLRREIKCRRVGNVLLPGRLPPEGMPAVFASAAALLVTLGDSPALRLTIPSKLQAYLAAGRPVVGSLNGEGARIIQEARAGFTCPAEDGDGLAAAVLALYGLAPEERCRLGENGRRYFSEHFDPERRVQELMEHFRDMAARAGKYG